jgi:(S)-ureidoglycine aminohydrolase
MESPHEPRIVPPNIFGHNRAVVTSRYAIMQTAGTLPSQIPGIENTTIRIQTAPDMGARFAQILLEMSPGGGTTRNRDEPLQHFFFVLDGSVTLTIDETTHELGAHDYAYVPVDSQCGFTANEQSRMIWIRKPYEPIDLPAPDPLVRSRDSVERSRPHTEGRYWQYLLPTDDLAFDMHVNILGFQPGNYFPYVETHIMEHGLYMLEGQGLYLLANDWHEAVVDDFIWMGPYCPQQFYCTGWGEAAYLLYKNVNRDVRFEESG